MNTTVMAVLHTIINLDTLVLFALRSGIHLLADLILLGFGGIVIVSLPM